MKIPTRLHEWAAERFEFVQYPRIRPANAHTAAVSTFGPRWKYAMPLTTRLGLLVIFSVWTIGCLLLLAFMAFVAYAVFT